jgi:K+/H+ antiporter YhaU regulatory subunit KhtT
VNEIVLPEAEASMTIIRHTLDYLNVAPAQAASYLSEYRSSIELAHHEPREGATDLPEVRRITILPQMKTPNTIGELRVRERFGVTILTITSADHNQTINPSPATRLQIGDRVRVFGFPEQIRAFEESLHG